MPRLAVLTIALLLALPVFAQPDAGDLARVESLISDLASEDWATREKASRELVGLGEDARDKLRESLEHDDPEVRVRVSNALISIGEEFAFAVECATSESESKQEHGRAALMNLFRIDDQKILRELTANELRTRWGGWNEQFNISAPPALALARLQAASGVRVLVAAEAAERWKMLIEKPTARIQVSGGLDQIAYVRDGVQRFIQTTLGVASANENLVPRPMRIGRTQFLYVTPADQGSAVARRCGEQLIADLLKTGAPSVSAASLLAEGASSDSEAAARIRKQYVENAELERLMWLAVALGKTDETINAIRSRDHSQVVELLASRDWTVIKAAAEYLECLEPDAKGTVLSPIVAESVDALQVVTAIWLCRGAPLNQPARARVGVLVSNKQDGLAAAAARWFAGAKDITDAELDAIWQAGEFQPLDGSFFTAALELVKREDIADRLVEHARKSFAGAFSDKVARHALAAAVLAGRATTDDLAVALEKLNGARNSRRLARQMAEMFSGCESLPQESIDKFVEGVVNADKNIRDVYMFALRRCDQALTVVVAKAASVEADEDTEAKHLQLSRVAMDGLLAGAGNGAALDRIIEAVEGEDMDLARAAGAAFVDAFEPTELFSTLEDMKDQGKVVHGAVAALEGYMEICRRAAVENDRVTFRKAYGVAINMEIMNQNWQLRNELMQLQGTLNNAGDDGTEQRLLPADPVLEQLTIE